MKRFLCVNLCALFVCCAATAALAQQYQPRQGYRQPQSGQPEYGQPRTASRSYSTTTNQYGQQGGNSDHKIALWLVSCNQAEIKLGKYAARHAESKDVRSFGEELAEDHQWLLEKLRRYAPEAGNGESSSNESTSSRGSDGETASSRGNEDNQNRSRQNQTGRTWNDAAVAQQISEQIVRRSRDELSEKEGNEFDRCFVGQLRPRLAVRRGAAAL